MQRILSITLALFIGLTFSIDAEARRFGGGKSFGAAPKHRQVQQQQRQQKQQPAAQQQQNTGKQAAAGSGASRWLGPLAGIAAGGLLASLLFGDAFEGLQIMDILLFAGIAFLIFRLLAARRQPRVMPAGGPMQREMPGSSPFGSSLGGSGTAGAAPVMQAPAWFRADSFLSAAREHFNQLQMHWDASDMDRIAEYVTPEMLGYLQKERAELGDGYQSTYIDNLDVQLDGVEELSDYTVATLSFSGISKTSRFDQGEAFSESWRMERKHGDDQPWLIAGIRQNA